MLKNLLLTYIWEFTPSVWRCRNHQSSPLPSITHPSSNMKFFLPSLLMAIQSVYAIPLEGNGLLPENPLDLSSSQCPPILVFRVLLKVRILVLTKTPRVRIEPFNRVVSVPPRMLAWTKMKMNSSIICSQKPRNAVEVSLASFLWKALAKRTILNIFLGVRQENDAATQR